MLQLPLVILLWRALEAHARTQFAPEDTYAFPKYHINFLNHHPITAGRAEELLSEGLRNGVKDFMGDYHSVHEGDGPTIDGPDDVRGNPAGEDSGVLNAACVCLFIGPSITTEEAEIGQCEVLSLPHSSSAKFRSAATRNPGAGRPRTELDSSSTINRKLSICEYGFIIACHHWLTFVPRKHRQGWFTYAYCHNHHVRQFKELEHSHPHPPGNFFSSHWVAYYSYTIPQAAEFLKKTRNITLTRSVWPTLTLRCMGMVSAKDRRRVCN